MFIYKLNVAFWQLKSESNTMKKTVYLPSIVASLLFILSLNSCNKNEDWSGYERGYIKNLTDFDGCRWIIELTDGQKLEPTNLGDYEIPLKENRNFFYSIYWKYLHGRKGCWNYKSKISLKIVFNRLETDFLFTKFLLWAPHSYQIPYPHRPSVRLRVVTKLSVQKQYTRLLFLK